jgi:hypothetical protein
MKAQYSRPNPKDPLRLRVKKFAYRFIGDKGPVRDRGVCEGLWAREGDGDFEDVRGGSVEAGGFGVVDDGAVDLMMLSDGEVCKITEDEVSQQQEQEVEPGIGAEAGTDTDRKRSCACISDLAHVPERTVEGNGGGLGEQNALEGGGQLGSKQFEMSTGPDGSGLCASEATSEEIQYSKVEVMLTGISKVVAALGGQGEIEL